MSTEMIMRRDMIRKYAERFERYFGYPAGSIFRQKEDKKLKAKKQEEK